jgi:ApbE superfamily uncharacterized protein (UPF0280 family)
MRPGGLCHLDVVEKESDLRIFTANYLLHSRVHELLCRYRQQIREYGDRNPSFLTSLRPVTVLSGSPEIVEHMARASAVAGVGPMAAVAGAIAHYVGTALAKENSEVIVENGGDLFITSTVPRRVLIHAGSSPFSERLALCLEPGTWGVCTSAGTVGHSLSFGRADAVVVVSRDAVLADAAATALGNLVDSESVVPEVLETAKSVSNLEGVVIIVGKTLGAWGNVRLLDSTEEGIHHYDQV